MDTRRLTAKASKEQLKELVDGWMENLPDSRMRTGLERDIYEAVNGPHFDEETYETAVSKLRNADGSTGPHWQAADIVNYARSHGCTFSRYTEWDVAYAMNMAYAVYYRSVSDTTDAYYKLAKAFLDDPNAKDGKAYRSWKLTAK